MVFSKIFHEFLFKICLFFFTCLYLWAWFVLMYLWFSPHVLEAFHVPVSCEWYSWQLCTWDLHEPVSCQWYSWSLICTCALMIWQACTFEPCMCTSELPQCCTDFGKVLASSPTCCTCVLLACLCTSEPVVPVYFWHAYVLQNLGTCVLGCVYLCTWMCLCKFCTCDLINFVLVTLFVMHATGEPHIHFFYRYSLWCCIFGSKSVTQGPLQDAYL